jgi:hypothetical protein
VDDAAISGEGRYRFKKREITKTGGRKYYLKAVPKKRSGRQESSRVDSGTRR